MPPSIKRRLESGMEENRAATVRHVDGEMAFTSAKYKGPLVLVRVSVTPGEDMAARIRSAVWRASRGGTTERIRSLWATKSVSVGRSWTPLD